MALLSEETGRQIAGTAPATAPQTLVASGTVLPDAGALLSGVVSVDIPPGSAWGIVTATYADGANSSGGLVAIAVLVGYVAAAPATLQIYRPESQNGAVGGSANVSTGCAIVFPIPPGAKRASATAQEVGDATHPGTFATALEIRFS